MKCVIKLKVPISFIGVIFNLLPSYSYKYQIILEVCVCLLFNQLHTQHGAWDQELHALPTDLGQSSAPWKVLFTILPIQTHHLKFKIN